jgi:hypothetical protein
MSIVINKFGYLTKDGKRDLQKQNELKEKKRIERKDKNSDKKKEQEHNQKQENTTNQKQENTTNQKQENTTNQKQENTTNKIQKLQHIYKKSETKELDFGDNMFLNSQYTVWVHRNDCTDWTESSYKSIYVINSIGSFWKFFNNFYALNKEENQFFIMKDKIKPIWEDNNNRNGGCYSMKLDCYDKNSKDDLASEVMISLCILIMNESLVPENNMINGISYSIKNKSVLIKIWTRNFNYNMEEKFPKGLLSKFNSVVKNRISFRRSEIVVAARYTPIKPEYEIQN